MAAQRERQQAVIAQKQRIHAAPADSCFYAREMACAMVEQLVLQQREFPEQQAVLGRQRVIPYAELRGFPALH